MTSRPNLWIFLPGALALAVFAAYAVLWTRGAAEMRKAVAAWADHMREDGGEVSFRRLRADGFPFLLRGVVEEVAISGDDWAWSAPSLYIDASPFSGDRIIISIRKPHVIEIARRRWRIDAPDGRASIARDKDRGWLLDVQSGPARIEDLGGKGVVSARSFLLSAAPNTVSAQRIFFGVDARGVEVTGAGPPTRIDAAQLAFAIDGAPGAKSLRDWRDAGGRLDVQRASIESGGAYAAFAGRLVLDSEGYPAGALNAEIANPAPIVDALRALGLVSPDDAAKAAAALTLAAIAGGGKISAPLSFEQGTAKVAGVKLGALPKALRPEEPQP